MKQGLLLALTIGLAACSSKPAGTPPVDQNEANNAAPPAVSAEPAVPAKLTPEPLGAAPNIIGLDGLGILKIGQPVPANDGWAAGGAQESDACQTVRSPDHPGVYAIVEGGKVRRITIRKGSDVKLVEGIGVGASESEVRKWFAGFREEPHKYEDAPAKYLTAPNARSGDPALRFEIGHDGKVSAMHVGTMPALAYVEGCS